MQEYMNARPAKAQSLFCSDGLEELLVAQPVRLAIINDTTTKIFTDIFHLKKVARYRF
jgi:hypothetical protein